MASPVRTIACIDDDENILKLNKKLLESGGSYKVLCFSSPKEALRNLGTIKPDLILLDMLMPEMDGIKVMEKLKADPETKIIPIIFMTAQKTQADVTKYMNLGALSVITKPIDPEEFPYQMEMLSKIVLPKK